MNVKLEEKRGKHLTKGGRAFRYKYSMARPTSLPPFPVRYHGLHRRPDACTSVCLPARRRPGAVSQLKGRTMRCDGEVKTRGRVAKCLTYSCHHKCEPPDRPTALVSCCRTALDRCQASQGRRTKCDARRALGRGSSQDGRAISLFVGFRL